MADPFNILTSGIPQTKPTASLLTNLVKQNVPSPTQLLSSQTDTSVTTVTSGGVGSDHRVRLRAIAGQEDAVYGPQNADNILSPLHNTGGLLFPYTPSIQFNQDVDYKSLELVHSNGEQYAYSRTPSVSLAVSGRFTVQNPLEGRYALAAIHFLRVVSKMWFGEQAYGDSANGGPANNGPAGLPPPILRFDGLGNFMFHNLKVILRNHNYTIEEQAQLVRIRVAGTWVYLPSLFTISMNLTVINTPTELREDFNLDDFRTGTLMAQGGWI